MEPNEESLYNIGKNYSDNCITEYTDEQIIIILRGFFDQHGNIYNKTILNKELICEINNLLDNTLYPSFKNLYKHKIEGKQIILINYNAIDFLHNIYKNSDARHRNKENYDIYLSWLSRNITIPSCKIEKTAEDAIIPFKNKLSDIGYNITIIKRNKKIGDNTFVFDTCIKVFPDFGYYITLTPSNNLIKSGYVLKNSLSVIEPEYNETIKLTLTKIDKSFPEIKLPFTCCKMILNKHIYYEIFES